MDDIYDSMLMHISILSGLRSLKFARSAQQVTIIRYLLTIERHAPGGIRKEILVRPKFILNESNAIYEGKWVIGTADSGSTSIP